MQDWRRLCSLFAGNGIQAAEYEYRNRRLPLYTREAICSDPSKGKTQLYQFVLPQKAKFVLICPGGAYAMTSTLKEGFTVAKALNQKGYSAFVLKYRVKKDACQPNPQEDLAAAVAYILRHAERLSVEATGYTVMGFSAGGHLAASFGAKQVGYAKYGLPVPSALILAYPVVTMGQQTHRASRRNLLGKAGCSDPVLIHQYSVEENVTPDYPPTFLWCCDDDVSVDPANSAMLADSLKRQGVFCRLVRYPSGGHGCGLGTGTSAQGWLEESLRFLSHVLT